ncbi:HK97 family phage prohead protease [Candidatus Lariskella endosymbiont of Hedychridium roseum]|uniref:HK97 family phage prohead protease n=1 Tax=Candidatus Lariskella endosymbiont of Hedychridium roseum TaxID=3077949 RepID=UPI0030D2021A
MKHTYTTYGESIQYDNKTLIKQANKINEQSKAIDDEGRFSGYASVFNVKDNTNDLVMPGAFRDNLKYPEKIRLLWQHDTLDLLHNLILR